MSVVNRFNVNNTPVTLNKDFINVNLENNHETAYSSSTAARNAVPASHRKAGLQITYLLTDGWFIEQYVGSDINGWETDSNWNVIGPISISQSTGSSTTQAMSQKAVTDAIVAETDRAKAAEEANATGIIYDATKANTNIKSLNNLISLTPTDIRKSGFYAKYFNISDNLYHFAFFNSNDISNWSDTKYWNDIPKSDAEGVINEFIKGNVGDVRLSANKNLYNWTTQSGATATFNSIDSCIEVTIPEGATNAGIVSKTSYNLYSKAIVMFKARGISGDYSNITLSFRANNTNFQKHLNLKTTWNIYLSEVTVSESSTNNLSFLDINQDGSPSSVFQVKDIVIIQEDSIMYYAAKQIGISRLDENVAKSLYTTKTVTNQPVKKITNTNNLLPDYVTSRLFPLGGKAVKAYFQEDKIDLFYSNKANILVYELDEWVDSNRAKLLSITEIDVAPEVDLSDYNITIPENGLCGINFNSSDVLPIGYLYQKEETCYDFVQVYNESNINNYVPIHDKASGVVLPYYVECEVPVSKVDYISGENIGTIQENIRTIQENIGTIQNDINALENSKSDKVCAIFGDSITYFGFDDLHGVEGWTHYFKNYFNFKSIKSYARAGAKWSCTSETKYNIGNNINSLDPDNNAYNQINRLLYNIENNGEDVPDYIIIMLGINDLWYNYDAAVEDYDSDINKCYYTDVDINYENDVPINTCTTIAKAIRHFYSMVINHLPATQVILLTPLQTKGHDKKKLKIITDIIIRCANECSMPVIDLYKEGGVCQIQERCRLYNTKDGTHLSETGAKHVGDFIAQRIKPLLR